MNNDIEQMFETQVEFCTKIFKEKYSLDFLNLSKEDKLKWSKEYVLSIMVEAGELLNELKWKTHRFEKKEDNRDNLLEEAIDCAKFLFNIIIVNGYNFENFKDKFFEKSKIVDIRYSQEYALQQIKENNYKKFVVIDVDGIMNNYPEQF